MKKMTRILVLVLLLLLVITATATATQPEAVAGFVPLSSLSATENSLAYDFCDPVLVGHAHQPSGEPGKIVHGEMTFGNVPNCQYTTDLTGTCEFDLLPVEIFGDPESKLGRAVLKHCTGDAEGLYGRVVIYNDYSYTAWYHWEP